MPNIILSFYVWRVVLRRNIMVVIEWLLKVLLLHKDWDEIQIFWTRNEHFNELFNGNLSLKDFLPFFRFSSIGFMRKHEKDWIFDTKFGFFTHQTEKNQYLLC